MVISHRAVYFLCAGPALLALAAHATAQEFTLEPIAGAVIKADDIAKANLYAKTLQPLVVADGKRKLENPTELLTHYGYASDGPMAPSEGDAQSKAHNVEASKTEPDKNTYLVLANQSGPDALYDYGKHFLFQGHEAGAEVDGRPQGYLTRINLDADEDHRVTLMADKDNSGKSLPFIDGSSWNPFTQTLLLTGEEGKKGGVWQAPASFPSKVEDLRGVFGTGSYEGIQADSNGSLWVVEDAGGKAGENTENAKQPNSFVYRLTPTDKSDLTKGGRLEALQVFSSDGQPIVFHDGKMDDDILAMHRAEIYGYSKSLKTRWVVVHDTMNDGNAAFDANKLAKAALATPFKRPENGVFRPGTNFTEFHFTATGDTNIKTEAGAERGGFGGVLKLSQATADAAEGVLSIVFRGDANHTGLDNLAFSSANNLMVGEDAGDKLHSQRKAFDSAFIIDVSKDYSAGLEPVRFLAIGRDKSATIDSKLADAKDTGFQNSGDNEITGLIVSDGDASVQGLLGVKAPNLADKSWRMLFTQQLGDNTTIEMQRVNTM